MQRSLLPLAAALYALALAAVPLRAQECAEPFWAAGSLEAYDQPREAVIADFDGDGLPDVAVTVSSGNLLHVFRQQAGGGYAKATYGVPQGVGFSTDDLTAGDVDGDGDQDLVMVNASDLTFTVFKNGGAGAFTWSQTTNQQFSYGDVQLGDLDRDGDLDLVTSGSGGAGRELSVYLNTAGHFTWSRDYAVAGLPTSIVIAQLDGDTAPDVVVAASDDGSVSVLWNTGTGVLQAPVRLATAAAPSSLAASDVNGDGRLDLLTGHPANQVSLFVNAGGRSFAPLAAIATGVRSTSIGLADFDLDGDADLAVTAGEVAAVPAGLSVLLNTGAGDFATFQRVANADSPGTIAIGDLDADGDPDLAMPANNGVRLFVNRLGRLQAAPRVSLPGSVFTGEAVAHGDLDGDGRAEVLVAHRTQVVVARHLGGGVLLAPVAYPAGTWLVGVAAGDVDSDGDVDVLAADSDRDDVALLRNTGGGVLQAPVRFPACDGPTSLTLRDMDGDLDLDAVVTCASVNSLHVLANDGTGAFAPWIGKGLAGSRPADAAAGDLDGDGDLDLAVVFENSDSVMALRRNPTGPLHFSQTWSATGCDGPESIALGDVNGDGRLDIAVNCRLGARVRFYLNAGNLTFTPGETPLVIAPLSVDLADVDGDSDLDLLAVRGNDDAVVLFHNDGAGHFTFRGAYTTDTDPWPMTVGDLDGDGDPDVATAGFQSGTASVLLNTRTGCPADAALSVAGTVANEGNAGTTALLFTVSLSVPALWPVTVDYATSDGTATAPDYEPTSGTLTFAPGETQKTVAVAVTGDTADEPDETVILLLSNASGAPVTTEQASGTIANDDAPVAALTIDVAGVEGGAGAVTAVPPGGVCANPPGQPLQCVQEIEIGASVTLTAEAAPDSAFLGWTGACSGTGACVVEMTEARQVGASFLGPRTLTVQVTGVEEGRGTLTVAPPPLGGAAVCDLLSGSVQVCTFQYRPDTVVSVLPSAMPDSKFVGWTGACSGTGPCDLTPAGPGPGPLVEASFLGPRTLRVVVASTDDSRGLVNVSPPSLDGASVCDALGQPADLTCTFRYAPGMQVTLQALPHPGALFGAWFDACTGIGPCTLTLDGPGPGLTATAVFVTANQPPDVNPGGPYAGVRGQPVMFDGSASSDPEGQPLTYTWSFDDGGSATGVAPAHVFATLGVHMVSLAVSDGHHTSGPAFAPVTITNAPPVVALTSPTNGTVASTSVPLVLSATAFDPDGAVVLVRFYNLDGTMIGEDTEAPYTLAWNAPPGEHLLTAIATDNDGAVTFAEPVFIYVDPGPVVALTGPANGAGFNAPASIPLFATATDNGPVLRVEFLSGDTVIATDTTAPYLFTWTNVPPGRYELRARAWDEVGPALSAPKIVDVGVPLAVAADSFVREMQPTSNFGTQAALETRAGSPGNNRWTHLRFDIGGVATIQAARLRLYGNLSATMPAPGPQVQVFASPVTSWAEFTITWLNQPPVVGGPLASVAMVTSSTASRWYDWDVTEYLQAEKAAGRTSVTFVLKNDIPTGPIATFRSRQAGSNRPELQILP